MHTIFVKYRLFGYTASALLDYGSTPYWNAHDRRKLPPSTPENPEQSPDNRAHSGMKPDSPGVLWAHLWHHTVWEVSNMPENLHDDAPRPEKTAGRLIAPFDPESWRQQVLELGLRIAVVLGAIVYAPSVLTAIRFDQWGIVLLDSLALAGVIALMVARRCPFMLRASLFSLILFMLGAWLMIEVGPISQIYLLGFSILTTLLLGLRVGIATVALNAATLLGIGLAGMAAPSMEIIGREPDLATWATIALNFLLVNIILVVAIGAVVHALERLVDRTREARDELERERAELVMANAALESEMFERARAEESRSAVESRLAATLESMTDAFYMLDREWRFTYINREAERIMQRPREELLGRVAHEEYPENAKGLIGRRYRHAMKTQEPILFEEFDEQLGYGSSCACSPPRMAWRCISGTSAGDAKRRRPCVKARSASAPYSISSFSSWPSCRPRAASSR
jgi:PAS domain S-box-containing protein